MSTRLEVRIRADKTGTPPPAGQPWPTLGMEIVGDPPTEFEFPTNWVAKAAREGWLTLEGFRVVERPSQPDPVDVDGSAGVSPEHRLATGGIDDPKPHLFFHADYLVLHTLTGDLRYRVDAQPDKYVDSDDPTDPVTLEVYAAGETRVDHFYSCVLETEGA